MNVTSLLEFIVKYWLEFVFGLVALGVSALARHWYKLAKQGRQYEKDQEDKISDEKTAAAIDELRAELKVAFAKRDNQIDQIIKENSDQSSVADNIRLGVLALYKKYFYETGRKLLTPSHTITYDEYIEFIKDHETYNGLGGNHEGD